MAQDPEIDALNLRWDAATDEVAADLTRYRDQIRTGMSPQEVATLKAAMTTKIERLEVLGQDPAEPIPPVEP